MPKNHRNYQKTRHIALSGLLFALAMALSFIEGTLVIPGLLPGMKLGLANIVTVFTVSVLGPKEGAAKSKALGFVAGFTGEAIEMGVAEKGVDADFVHLNEGFSRINVKIKSGEETELNGQGPKITDEAIRELYVLSYSLSYCV